MLALASSRIPRGRGWTGRPGSPEAAHRLLTARGLLAGAAPAPGQDVLRRPGELRPAVRDLLGALGYGCLPGPASVGAVNAAAAWTGSPVPVWRGSTEGVTGRPADSALAALARLCVGASLIRSCPVRPDDVISMLEHPDTLTGPRAHGTCGSGRQPDGDMRTRVRRT